MSEYPSYVEAARADALYPEAIATVRKNNHASISGIQRVLKIGYNRAAGFIETMEADGIVSAPDFKGARKVLKP